MKVALTDKVVIITGAASGIGAAIAQAVAEAGGVAGLLLTDRDAEGLDAMISEVSQSHRSRSALLTCPMLERLPLWRGLRLTGLAVSTVW